MEILVFTVGLIVCISLQFYKLHNPFRSPFETDASRPILSPSSGYSAQAVPYLDHAVRHDVVFPSFGSRAPGNLERQGEEPPAGGA